MWFDSLGFEKVFWTKFLSQLEIGVPVFLAAMLLVRIYLKSLKKHYFIEVESHEIPDEKRLNKISWGMSVVFGLLVGLSAGAAPGWIFGSLPTPHLSA